MREFNFGRISAMCARASDQLLNPSSESLGAIDAESERRESAERPAGATGSLIRRQPNRTDYISHRRAIRFDAAMAIEHIESSRARRAESLSAAARSLSRLTNRSSGCAIERKRKLGAARIPIPNGLHKKYWRKIRKS